MDINSLLSPQDSPAASPSPQNSPPARRLPVSPFAPPNTKSPLSNTVTPSPTSTPVEAAPTFQRPALPARRSGSQNQVPKRAAQAATSRPKPPVARHASTSGMDTLADLASMQHHQHAARTATTAPSSLRNPVEPHDAPSTTHHTTATPQPAHPTTMRPSLQSISRAHSGSRSSIDIAMAEAPTQTPSPRAFASNSLSPEDLASLTELVQYLAEHPHAYAAHVRLIEILFAGLVTHVADETKDPRDYDLLADLQQAVEAMASRYALGEELWIRRLEMQRLLAGSLEDCLALVETLERAVVEEAGSTKIWAFYGDWMAALHDAAVGAEQSDYVPLAEEPLGRLVNLSDEDRLVAAEVFGRESLLAVWKRGVDATKYNLSYSQPLWNRYTALLLQDIAAAPAPEAVAALKAHFVDRLKTPHAQWEDTFQQFSTFMSTYDNAAYEQTMVAVNRQTADAKETRIVRETYEARLRNKIRDGDREAEWVASTQYLEWEMSHNRKKGKVFSYRLLTTLFQRVLLRFPTAAETWEELLLFLGDDAEPHPAPRASLLPTLNQACAHCPWSGALWAAYIQGAEREDLPFPDIGQIKHKATSTGLLDADTGQGQGQDGSDGGLENTLAVHAAWCGFLRRRAFRRDATDEERDVAEVGLRSALEDAETLGRRRQQEAAAAGTGGANGAHNEYRGDPQYRLERTYIKFLDQSRNVGAAREAWRGLVPRHGDSYEFWLRYYEWEMRTWARLEGGGSGGGVPRDATGVLQQAARRQQMDWPEKILETYQRHCEDHEDVATIQAAVRLVRKRARDVARRREREQAATQLQQQREQELAQLEVEENGDAMEEDAKTGEGAGKRKRDEATNGDSGSAAKRTKASPEASVEPAKPSKAAEPEPVRDREHTSVLVKGLPWDATEKRVRHFFRECGSIKSVIIAVDKGTASATATIEFDDKQDVLTARTKDMKQFDGREIHVEVGQGSIVYVTNFPPKADEEYLRSLFGKYGEIVDIRFPSTKFNAKRRFCYIQFRASEQAQAATQLDATGVEGDLKLVAKLSDPNHKAKRHGAIYEGREVYVSNVDWGAGEDDVKEVFEKYGPVERVRIPRSKDGKSKGMAFVVFEVKDNAESSLELDKTKFKSRLLHVEMATSNPHKKG